MSQVEPGGRRSERRPLTVLTVGHGARSIEAFLDLLRGAAVTRLVDVRTAPGSRKHPQFGRDALAASLERAGIAYEWSPDLGGWRKPRPDSRHTALRSAGFRGYADHMETEEFRSALRSVIDAPSRERVAIMCAESLWWRCHRRLIADALDAPGVEVLHLMEGGRQEPHRRSEAARIDDLGRLVYDRAAPEPPAQASLLDGS